MCRIMIRSTSSVFMMSLSFLIMVLSTFCTFVSAVYSPVVWNVALPSAYHHDVDTMSDLLLARAGAESQVLVKAKQLIQDLSSSTTCSHVPTVRLLRQCKNIKPKYENAQSDHQLNNAESVYAISMALCEAQQARVTTPPACRLFESILDSSDPELLVEIVRPSEIEACSAVLYGTPGWTSYSTYKSNSKFLCESSRTDYQREELLQTLRDATGVIPEILDALKDHRTEAQIAMMQLRDTAAHVDSAQQAMLMHAQEQGQLHFAQVQQLVQSVESLQSVMAEAVTENSKVLDLSTEKAGAVDRKLTELYASFVEAATGLTFDLDQQLASLSGQTALMLNQIHDLSTKDNLDNLQAAMSAVAKTAAELARLQVTQIATGQEVLEAFNNFNPHQLLPKWLMGLSVSANNMIASLRNEGAFALIFAAPASVLLMFGRFRHALSMVMAYAFARSLWSYVSLQIDTLVGLVGSRIFQTSVTELLYLAIFAGLSSAIGMMQHISRSSPLIACYMTCRSLSIYLQLSKDDLLNFVLDRRVQSAGCCLLVAFIICFCANAALKIVNKAWDQRPTTFELAQKQPKHDVKKEFERTRRACSVPLDCECA